MLRESCYWTQLRNLPDFHPLAEPPLTGLPQPNEMAVIGILVSVEQDIPELLSASGC